MARYEIYLKRSAAKELAGIPKRDLKRVVARLRALAADPRPRGCRKLSGGPRYRVRQGHYRIVYSIQDYERSVWIVRIGHRRDVYDA